MFKKLICCALLGFCSLASAKALQPLTVLLDWFPNPTHAPLFVAQEQGFFKQQGLKVTLIGPADPADPPKLVAAGKADIAVDYQPEFMLQVAQGLPLVRIATLVATPLDCLVVLADGPIHSLRELKGKRIGYSVGATKSVMLDTMLQSVGLNTKDVTRVNAHYDLSQALLSKKVDAVTGIMRNYELLQLKLAGHPARAFYPEEHGVPSYNELILVTNKKELKDPRLPKFLRALDHGVEFLINHPQLSWEVFAKHHPELNNKLNHDAWFDTLPRFALRPAALDKQRFANFAKFLEQHKLVKHLPPVNQYAVVLPH